MSKIVFLLLVCPLLGHRVHKTCQQMRIDPIETFNATEYLGLWYEIQRTPNAFEVGTCATADYGVINSTFLSVKNSETLSDGATSSAEGYARLDEDGEGALFVKFSRSPESPYWIVGTDYENYSVVWSCKDITERDSYQLSWVLSRKPELSTSAREAVDGVLRENNLSADLFEPTEQGGKECGRSQSFL